MFNRLLISLFCLGTFCSLQLHAGGGDALIARLKPTGSITDQANLLSASKEQQLRSTLDSLEAETGAALVVVTLPSMEGGQIDDFTNRLFEAWGVGDADKDNGVMLLVAVKERKMRIEVGYGLEGILPDGVAGQIRDDYILAYFKKGQMAAGVESGALALANRIAQHYGVNVAAQPSKPARKTRINSDRWPSIFIFLVIAAYIINIIRRSCNGSDDDHWGGGGRRYSSRRRRYYGGGWYSGGSGRSSGGFGGGGGFGGFGGGSSGGGGASGGW